MPFAVAAGVSAVAGIAGSAIQGSAATSAANTEAQAAEEAAKLQAQEYQQTQIEEAPYIQSGNAALQALMQGVGFTQTPGTTSTGATGTGTTGNPAAQIQWLQGNTGPKTQAMISAYLAANPGQTPTQQLQGILAAGLGPADTKAFDNPLNQLGPQGAVTGAGGWTYSGTPGPLDAPFNPANLAQTPGYQFTLQQGENAVENAASATGGVGGGNTLKAITGYAEGLADTTYQQQLQDYMAQQQQQYGALTQLTGSGQNAAANLGAIGSSAATNAGNALIGAGNAQAAGTIGSANALTSGLAGLSQNFLLANSSGLSGSGVAGFGVGAAGYDPANTYTNITAGYGPGG